MNRVLVGYCWAATISLAATGAGIATSDTSAAQQRGGAVGSSKYLTAETGIPGGLKVASTRVLQSPTPYVPKTEMGRAMLAARQRILDAGEKLTPAKELMEALDNSRLSG